MHPERPQWLDEEAEICALLHAALDRFDRQRGVDRQRRITMTAQDYLPSLGRADAGADQTWSLIQELARRGVLAIRKASRSLYDVDWQGAKVTFVPEVEETLRVWLRRDWSEPAAMIWRRAIERHAQKFHDAGAALLPQRIVIENRSADDIVAALAAAADIRVPMTLRQLSATVFWGDSKILDERGELVAALLPHLEIRDRALVIAVHLPERCKGVLFIENQDTYTAAAAGTPTEALEFALVYAAGFRGTAARVRNRAGALVHYAGPGLRELASRFDAWWYDGGAAFGPAWFWGDLDFAGMQILKSLRSRFEGLEAWPVGYDPLRVQLQAGGGYGTRADDSKGQVDPVLTGCAYADSVLLPAIRGRGRMDQEFRR
jgi:Uncharacterized protein conserved in bacteria C-term(DUF2220)